MHKITSLNMAVRLSSIFLNWLLYVVRGITMEQNEATDDEGDLTSTLYQSVYCCAGGFLFIYFLFIIALVCISLWNLCLKHKHCYLKKKSNTGYSSVYILMYILSLIIVSWSVTQYYNKFQLILANSGKICTKSINDRKW